MDDFEKSFELARLKAGLRIQEMDECVTRAGLQSAVKVVRPSATWDNAFREHATDVALEADPSLAE